MSDDVASLFTQHKMALVRRFSNGSAGYECENCGDRKTITKGQDGIYYGSKTTVIKPRHEVVESAPADFNGWCPAAPQNRPDHFDTGKAEGK